MTGVRPRHRSARHNVPEAADAVEENQATPPEGAPQRAADGADGAAARGDGLVAAYAVAGYAPVLVRWAASRGLSPATVSAISFGLGALAAVWFSAGSHAGMVAGAGLLYVSFVLDCVAGTAGASWPATVLCLAKEAAVYAGLAVGAGVQVPGGPGFQGNAWAAAVGALALLSVRHAMDAAYTTYTTYTAYTADAASRHGRRPHPGHPHPGHPHPGGPRQEFARRALRALALPVGERFALIAVTAGIAGARVTFGVLLLWGSAAAVFVLAGHVCEALARTLRAPGSEAP
ncbi:DUF5941 domain-containing protein [Actinomadura opuntiae]|uniref:DUF5941 domain-containing protein n=1 Tax=Actinomadura sp. OS1-43 TaxID=604315 RepID=UPI00255B0794|nr:DUF5941 domain-containing protein [Actinomadura sp. OS1-43]MDL4814708.1 DUF5941 domain-containing protein [Actinomadura sp. OS1-43]